jgi:hypothetical protein
MDYGTFAMEKGVIFLIPLTALILGNLEVWIIMLYSALLD